MDDERWQLHYLVVTTCSWRPDGGDALIRRGQMDRTDWVKQPIHESLTRRQVQRSSAYLEAAPISPDGELTRRRCTPTAVPGLPA